MFRLIRRFFPPLVLLAFLAACATVPGTGRSQLSLVDDAELNSLAQTQYRQMLQSSPLSRDRQATAMIKRVGQRLSRAAEQYLREYGRAAEIPSYKWEFNLIESAEPNAFCLPSGKVAFYSGILPYCLDETGVAVVMGHEVAHAIAHHSRERASQEMMTSLGGLALSLGLGIGGVGSLSQDIAMTAFGLGTEVGILLPFSRSHESEADRIGLSLMAMAGYDPSAALGLWQRMGSGGGGFMSTHPSSAQRMENIRKYLPEAQARYRAR